MGWARWLSKSEGIKDRERDVDLVHIEFQRVQAWLFSVPRLRGMVGANTLLGEVLRRHLIELAKGGNDGAWSLAPSTARYPDRVPHDPLTSEDDPADDATAGILSRDGGHFEAQFATGAVVFADAASQLIRKRLPGLRFAIQVEGKRRAPAYAVLSNELPVLAPCDWTGRNLASKTVWQGSDSYHVSGDAFLRHEAAKRAEDGTASDLASRLTHATRLRGLQRPQSFEHLTQGEYLAVIHADGNGLGDSARGLTDEKLGAFHHTNRVLVRCALAKAIDNQCHEAGSKVASLGLLMLGGDDILVVCRASVALSFVVDLCKELDRQQTARDASFRLTLGIGIAIARPTLPFHRLHSLVEALAASAKRKYRGLQEKVSVVDWAVYTESWAQDPEKVRVRDWISGQQPDLCVLSRRPVVALGSSLDTLEGLLEAAAHLSQAPRSQARFLVDQLPRGRSLAELAFAELSPAARQAFEKVGVKEVWTELEAKGIFTTPILDLIEVCEIPKLGSASTVERTEPEVEFVDESAGDSEEAASEQR